MKKRGVVLHLNRILEKGLLFSEKGLMIDRSTIFITGGSSSIQDIVGRAEIGIEKECLMATVEIFNEDCKKLCVACPFFVLPIFKVVKRSSLSNGVDILMKYVLTELQLGFGNAFDKGVLPLREWKEVGGLDYDKTRLESELQL